mmetsp:Transcript_26278/g.102720  ORF Transcript_26278/g.102720 Transcript_26278/m.102720 type:complete len:80 (+) Transcript_26278:1145-1384(+)
MSTTVSPRQQFFTNRLAQLLAALQEMGKYGNPIPAALHAGSEAGKKKKNCFSPLPPPPTSPKQEHTQSQFLSTKPAEYC